MFATLIGTNKETNEHINLANKLSEIAIAQGFLIPNTPLRVEPNQTSLAEWNIELLGPPNADADFLLAVTAPSIPTVSPIPVMKTVTGPMFSVSILPSFYGVYSGADYSEFKEVSYVINAFEIFLLSRISIEDMPPAEFALYTAILFLGGIVCSKCGVEFPLQENRPVDNNSLWAGSTARKAINKGWKHVADAETVTLCAKCPINS